MQLYDDALAKYFEQFPSTQPHDFVLFVPMQVMLDCGGHRVIAQPYFEDIGECLYGYVQLHMSLLGLWLYMTYMIISIKFCEFA